MLVRAAERNLLTLDGAKVRALRNPIEDLESAAPCETMERFECGVHPLQTDEPRITQVAKEFLSEYARMARNADGGTALRMIPSSASSSRRQPGFAELKGRRVWLSDKPDAAGRGCSVELRDSSGNVLDPKSIHQIVSAQPGARPPRARKNHPPPEQGLEFRGVE